MDAVLPATEPVAVLGTATSGLAGAALGPGEGAKLLRDWSAFKSRSIGKSEGQKDGTGRVCIYR